MPGESVPKVLIVGGGFAGLAAANALRGAAAQVILIDRRNHHVFQPLLYQVATASLSPADISASIRAILRDQRNCQVIMAEVNVVDIQRQRLRLKCEHLECERLEYDYLILAAGATHSYFGHDDWATIAPGLKSVEDAIELRRRILLAFESAEYEADEKARRAALTFAIVGAGPTGVELAGAIKEVAARTISKDYRHIDTTLTRVIVFEGQDRVLPPFPPSLSRRAHHDLKRLGVEIHLNAMVTEITDEGIYIGDAFTPARNVFWAAGVKASEIGQSLGVATDRAGRVHVRDDLTIDGHPEVFVVGDLAAAALPGTDQTVPGVAQAAIQMGRYTGNTIAREIAGRSSSRQRPAFVYHDKGMLAIIGKARAVARIGRFHFTGFLAWLMWGGVHIAFLIGFRNRIAVLLSWLWYWLINARDARLITGEARLDVQRPRLGHFPKPQGASSARGVKTHQASSDSSPDKVEQRSIDSFPCSDPPGYHQCRS